jgi:glycerol-3-phosphate O-acyltransferase / dihydroxyacetone phosphate acyltransferase
MRILKKEARRRVAFLIAEKSMHRPFVGFLSRLAGAIPVGRALDRTSPAKGKIYLPDPDNDPLLVRGYGTNFEEFQVGGLLVLPKVNQSASNAEIAQIIGPGEIRLKKAFGGSTAVNQLTGRQLVVPDGKTEKDMPKKFQGTSFEIAPKIDQKGVYEAVFSSLSKGRCVGIFPEGGSHDRPDLLPFKGRSISNPIMIFQY